MNENQRDDLDDINMERLNRDLRHALDFESLDNMQGAANFDQRLMDRSKGLTREQIAKMRVTVLGYDNMAEYRERGACVICLNDFKVKDKTKELICTHAFHERCIDNWLTRARECPLCKRNAIAEDSLVNE